MVDQATAVRVKHCARVIEARSRAVVHEEGVIVYIDGTGIDKVDTVGAFHSTGLAQPGSLAYAFCLFLSASVLQQVVDIRSLLQSLAFVTGHFTHVLMDLTDVNLATASWIPVMENLPLVLPHKKPEPV